MIRSFQHSYASEKFIKYNELDDFYDFSIWRSRKLFGNSAAGLSHCVISIVLGCAVFVAQGEVFAASSDNSDTEIQAESLDGLGFIQATRTNQFSPNLRIESSSLINPQTSFRLKSVLEVDSPAAGYRRGGLILDDDSIADAQGFKVRRFSTAMESSRGTLTVGSDWSNFQDFLDSDDVGYPALSQNGQNGLTSEQIRWNSTNGFSVALESEAERVSDTESINSGGYKSSPSLVLSWNGSAPARRGQYSFSLLGRQLELEDVDRATDSEEKLGWGLNLAGGWRFGDLFAALRVTLGNSIDKFILGRFGSTTTTQSTTDATTFDESFSINPSLNYRLGENASIHVAINRFESDGDSNVFGVDTLDTVHLGYSWNPWPSTQFGVEFVGKDVEGNSELSDSNEVNFAASKRF